MGFLWGYQRTVHWILLLSVIVAFSAYYAVQYIFNKKVVCDVESVLPALAVVFLVLLWIRGSSCCNCCFPFFHYSTLIVELLVQIASLVLECMILCKDTMPTFKQQGVNPTYDWIVYGLTIVAVVLYSLLVLKLLPVLTTLCCGGQSDKEELDKETKGESSTEHQPVAP